jgi:hypothetical protein
MRTILLLLVVASVQETTDKPAAVSTRPPRKGEFAPGQLSDDAKRKKFDDLTNAIKKGSKAPTRRKRWLEGLEKDFGIYDVATIVDNGDVARRLDITIISAGYPKSDAAKVNRLADSLKTNLLQVDPFHNYPLYINFHRVNVNDPGGGSSSRIPFRVANGILTCESRRALEMAEHAPDADLVVVLCNTPPARGTADGRVITIDAGLDLGYKFLHEMGHAFAGLKDEYVEPGNEKLAAAPLTADQEESVANVTTIANPKLSKWHYWMPETWNSAYAPNRLPPQHKVGCFEGANYFGRGAYRPEENCLMRAADRYCVVCAEHVETQFYRLIAPIDDARPRRTKLGLWSDDSTTFEANAIQTQGRGNVIGEFHGLWYVDARNVRPTAAKNLTTALTLQAADLGPGVHEVALRVDFSNNRVRRDFGWLSSARGWVVDVGKHRKPKFEGPSEVRVAVGKPLDLAVRVDNPDPATFRLEAADLPEGATFANGRLSWTPSKAHQGGWRPRFTLTDGVRSVVREVEISVVDPAEKNYRPVFQAADPVTTTAGETLDLPIPVVDFDGDNLAFACANLPEGAELDPYEGLIRWRPAASQVGRHALAIDVWDGTTRVKGTVDLVVEENPLLRRNSTDAVVQLRSPSAETRAFAVGKPAPLGRAFRFLEAARLLRDRSASVRSAALEVARGLSETDDETFLTMMVKDLAPHAWAFTDDAATLKWLAALGAKDRGDKADLELLRGSLRGIEKYNRERGLTK